MKKSTRQWVRKAEDDYQLAVQIAQGDKPHYDQRCFLCQQSAEKFLKALLEEIAVSIPKTHVLDDLHNLLVSHFPELHGFRRGLIYLSDFAVAVRYPGRNASNGRFAMGRSSACRVQ
ncbi:MAG TPA: HEPN domain-containing protein [Gemmataceae bacterium]|nr:HEPN domain-containing protein [Gemmataceae bacterium]